MTTEPRCPECGDTGRLDPSGVCAWRAGCEHRQMVSEARIAELDRFLELPVRADPGYLDLGTVRGDAGRNDFAIFTEEFEQLGHFSGGRLWFENGQWYEETWGDDDPADQG